MNFNIANRLWPGIVRIKKGLCLLLVLTEIAACGGGSNAAPPASPPPPPPPGFSYAPPADIGDQWVVAHAGDLGMPVERLEAMMDAIDAGIFDIVDSVAIAYRGQLILHETLRTALDQVDAEVGNTDLDVHALFSITKSFASILVGIAIDQGILADVDVPYLSLFSYTNIDNWDARKDDITLHDVLAMQAGFDWNEWDPPYTDPDNQLIRFLTNETDFAKAVLDLPMVADPGTVFSYNTASTSSLGQAIENSAPLSLIDYAFVNLLGPLGISKVETTRTPTGLPDIGRGLYLTTRDQLKFGQLMLDGGVWAGQQILSEAWVTQSTEPLTPLGWADPDSKDWQLDGYAYQWWTGYFDVDGRQIESLAARGYGQQVLMIVPEFELVVAVNSHAWQESADQSNQVFKMIREYILPAAMQ